METKRRITVALTIICGLLTIAAGLAWIDNISISRQWHSDIMHNNNVSTNGGNNAEIKKKMINIAGKEYSGPIPFFDKVAGLDYSTVTTLIPFFGFLGFTIGVGRILWKRDIRRLRPEYFPFFRSYNGITVTLGLIGTIWGLIMIGFYHEPDVDDLTSCLHTALFSTLVALMWVYLIALPARHLMQWWDRQLYSVPKIEDFGGEVEKLLAAISETGNNLKSAGDDVMDFAETVETAQQQIKGIVEKIDSAAGKFDKTFTKFGNILESQGRLIEEQRANNASQQRVLDTFLQTLEQLQQANRELGTEVSEHRRARELAESKLRTIIETLKS